MRAPLTVVWAAAALAALLVAGPGRARAASPAAGAAERLLLPAGDRSRALARSRRRRSCGRSPARATWRSALTCSVARPAGPVTEIRGEISAGSRRRPTRRSVSCRLTCGACTSSWCRSRRPPIYHLRAEFRWTGSGGRVLSTVTRLSPGLPSARAASLTSWCARSPSPPLPDRPHRDLYTALIANTGNSPAGTVLGPVRPCRRFAGDHPADQLAGRAQPDGRSAFSDRCARRPPRRRSPPIRRCRSSITTATTTRW